MPTIVYKYGTINELTGQGHEILVDVATRSIVLAVFLDGNFTDRVACKSGETPIMAPLNSPALNQPTEPAES